MEKSQRDRILNRMSPDERHEFRRLLQEVRAEMQAASGQRVSASDILATKADNLDPGFQAALEATMARDQMGPNAGDPPPDFILKRLGSEEWVQLSSFRGQRPVALIFGSYT